MSVYSEEVGQSPDGANIVYLTYKVPLYDKKNCVVGVLGTSIDITKRKQAEEQLKVAVQKAEAANKAKSDFLAVMSHELRTPLNGIMGMSQVLKESEVSKAIFSEYVDSILLSGNELLGLINDILDFTKADLGQLTLENETFDLHQMLDRIRSRFAEKASEHGLQFAIDCDASVPQWLIGDVRRVRQILTNFITNALKFTHHGYIRIKVSAHNGSKDAAVVRFSVEDTGIGIPEDQLFHVFEKFKQARTGDSKQYARKYGGTGLGLAIVKQLVDMMDGKVSVTSKLGNGSVFVCELPLKTPIKKLIRNKSSSKEIISQNFLQGKHILLVEDNLMNQKVAKLMLEGARCKVDVASSGEEALSKLFNSYDLVLMDVSLPDISGLDVTSEYRRREKSSQHTPIIALTAHALAGDKELCINAGMDDYLVKPLIVEKLYDILKSWLKNKTH